MGVPGFLRPTKRKIIILAVLMVISLTGIYFYTRPRQTDLQLTEVKRQEIKSTVSSSGTLTGKSSADLRFMLPGKLTFINVKTGDSVFAGQLLAGLDTQQLAIQLQQAQNTLRDKQATTDKVIDDIHLFQYGNGGFANVGTPNETMTQRQLRTTAEVARDNAFDSIKESQRAFQDTVIVSPINGLVTQAIEVPNQVVLATDLIAQVVDTSAIYFDAEVDEADIGKIKIGLPAEILLDTYPERSFSGFVEQIIPQTQTTTQGAKVIIVRIRLNNPPVAFIQGLTGLAAIVIESRKGSLTIPLEALRDDNTVLVQEGKNLISRKVTPGIMSDTDIEIKDGLKEGDKVQLNPPPSGR